MQIKQYQQIIENGRAPFESCSNRLDSKRAHPKSFLKRENEKSYFKYLTNYRSFPKYGSWI